MSLAGVDWFRMVWTWGRRDIHAFGDRQAASFLSLEHHVGCMRMLAAGQGRDNSPTSKHFQTFRHGLVALQHLHTHTLHTPRKDGRDLVTVAACSRAFPSLSPPPNSLSHVSTSVSCVDSLPLAVFMHTAACMLYRAPCHPCIPYPTPPLPLLPPSLPTLPELLVVPVSHHNMTGTGHSDSSCCGTSVCGTGGWMRGCFCPKQVLPWAKGGMAVLCWEGDIQTSQAFKTSTVCACACKTCIKLYMAFCICMLWHYFHCFCTAALLLSFIPLSLLLFSAMVPYGEHVAVVGFPFMGVLVIQETVHCSRWDLLYLQMWLWPW